MMTRTNPDGNHDNYNGSNLGEIYSKLLVYSAFDLIESAPFTYLPLWLKASNQQSLGDENKQVYGLLQALVASISDVGVGGGVGGGGGGGGSGGGGGGGGSGGGSGGDTSAAGRIVGEGADKSKPLNFYSLVFHVFYKHYQRFEDNKH